MKILFKNARILTMIDENIIEGDLLVKDNRIAYIGNESDNYAPFDRVIECNKNLLMPGFKNAHTHSAMVFLRGKADDVNLQEWLFNIVFPREEKLIPSDIYHLNKVAYLEYLSSGITACFDHYFFPLEAAKAAEEFGMRTLLLGTHDPLKTSVEDLKKNYLYFKNKKDGLVTYTIGFHAEYTTDEALLEGTKQAIEELKCPFYTHIAETQKEVMECLKRHDKTPAQFLYDEGLFKYGGGGFHCIYLTGYEERLFAKNGLNIVTCPASNAKLASGVAPLSRYVKKGINVALGTDGPASNNSLDMFKEMYLAATLQKLADKRPDSIPAFEILKMATVNGAKAIGMNDADVLAVNKLADIIMIDLSKPNMQPINNIVTNLVYAGSKDNVKLTMINGRILYENGQYFINEKVEDIYQKAEEIAHRLEK